MKTLIGEFNPDPNPTTCFQAVEVRTRPESHEPGRNSNHHLADCEAFRRGSTDRAFRRLPLSAEMQRAIAEAVAPPPRRRSSSSLSTRQLPLWRLLLLIGVLVAVAVLAWAGCRGGNRVVVIGSQHSQAIDSAAD